MSDTPNPTPIPQSSPGLAEFDWQKARKRPNAGGIPVRGFGPGGKFTLWLPSSKVTRNRRFVGGRLIQEETAAAGMTEEMHAMRRDVLARVTDEAPGRLRVPLLFMDYAAALIRANYDVSDDDLTLMLCSGDKWHQPIIYHILGGEEYIDLLADRPGIGVQAIGPDMPPLSWDDNYQPIPYPETIKTRRPWWKFWGTK